MTGLAHRRKAETCIHQAQKAIGRNDNTTAWTLIGLGLIHAILAGQPGT